MAQVLVRNLDEVVVDRLRRRAAASGRSLEAELRLVLTAAAGGTVDARLAALEAIRADIRAHQAAARLATPSDSTELIRADRDR
ncbi:MAG: hypothetical protein FJ102_15880 [Deltaproteobacteria bacterium]|nr:hypothetical protein [Deltaproteobacteria bacterium]